MCGCHRAEASAFWGRTGIFQFRDSGQLGINCQGLGILGIAIFRTCQGWASVLRLVLCAGIQVKEAGLATHFVESSYLPELLDQIDRLGAQAGSVEALEKLISGFEVCFNLK